MNIVEAIILWVTGILVGTVFRKIYKNDDIDYSQYDIAVGTVLGTENFCGGRWIVDFTDFQGNNVLGMDDRIAVSTFFPEKHHLPKRKTQEKVYYWEHNMSSRYRINERKVDYYIHFCDETLYQLMIERNKRKEKVCIGLGVVFALLGIIVLFFGQ